MPLGLKDSAPRPKRQRGRRGQQAEADHQAALARAYAYEASRARSAEALEALGREYERRMAEGPDFTRCRAKSEFREAPRHRLDRNELARLRFAFNSMARGSWQHRDAGRHRGVVSRTCRDVFGALIFLAERYDRLFPSLLRLAALAQCCKQSVVTALALLERLGFLTRHRRLRRVKGLLGMKAEQDTNAYELHMPRRGWGALGLVLFSAGSESKSWAATGTGYLSYLKAHPETWGGRSVAYGDACGEPPTAAQLC